MPRQRITTATSRPGHLPSVGQPPCWRNNLFYYCCSITVLLSLSSQCPTSMCWALSPSNNKQPQRIKPSSQGGRSLQNNRPRHLQMSDAAIVFSDFHNDGGDASLGGLSNVVDKLTKGAAAKNGIRRKKYKRKLIPETEKEKRRLQLVRQAEYRQVVEDAKADGCRAPSIWSFESLFPDPVWDEKSIKRDLYAVKKRDTQTIAKLAAKGPKNFRENVGPLLSNKTPSTEGTPYDAPAATEDSTFLKQQYFQKPETSSSASASDGNIGVATSAKNAPQIWRQQADSMATPSVATPNEKTKKVDRGLTRMVEDKIFGYRRTQTGQFQYETSLMGDGAIKFRDGVRLGNPLPVNTDRLTYHAKKELQHGRIEESRELYERACQMDPRDGRAYLGLSRCAERRRDFELARAWLRAGIQNSKAGTGNPGAKYSGGNPFLLQALGRLEEKRGHLSAAESLYVQAARSRPSHAAAWVSLAQLRTRKLGQTVASGRVCYETAERELRKAGLPPNSHVYTAWASLEYKGAGDVRRARQLFQSALKVDPKCSAAWLQLGVMEADGDNFEAAQECFEKVLTFDQRNSRVLQAYALMEIKRPDGDSRKAIELFERALKVNPRDAGVLQPYALYVAELGDLEAARKLLQRGTEVSKRHAPVWQAWGVLEMRHGHPEEARKIFQQGIWACAQLAGNQSGGYHCARLWQAWGVLEAREGNHPEARRCFSRALDADSRNVATVTAWTQMEEDLGNGKDARLLFERSLKDFSPGCDAKMILWRAYELMEQRAGNVEAALHVYQRSVRETFSVQDDQSFVIDAGGADAPPSKKQDNLRTKDQEVEVSRWNGGMSSMKGEVWMNNGSIETKLPMEQMKKKSKQTKQP